MSLPITAVGPLNVLTKPILTDLPWLMAGPAPNARTAAAANSSFFMVVLPFSPLVNIQLILPAGKALTRPSVSQAPARAASPFLRPDPLPPRHWSVWQGWSCAGRGSAPCHARWIFTYSKSPALLSMPTLGGAIQEANLPGSQHGCIRLWMKSPSAFDGSHCSFLAVHAASLRASPSGEALMP